MNGLKYLPTVSVLVLTSSVSVPAYAQQTTEASNPASRSTSSSNPADAAGASATASNGSSGKSRLEEIVVTAQRRSEKLQNVPIAVTALGIKDIQQKGLSGTLELAAAVPNLTIMKSGPSILNPFIRGVGEIAGGPNDEPSVATYVDGVYIASPSAAATMEFNNIDRVEVLKGPQGTLFGRNATGGVIQIITRDPSHTPGFDGSVEYGNYRDVRTNAYLTTGITSWAATDLAVYYENQMDGYGENFTTHTPTFTHRDFAVRSKTFLTPTATTQIRISADYSKTNADSQFQLAQGVIGIDGVTTYPGRYNGSSDLDFVNRVKQIGGSVRIDQDLGAFRIASISAYRHNDIFFTFDQDLTPLPAVPVYLSEFQHNFSQELQLLSPSQSKINWLLGAFYYNSKAGEDPVRLAGAASAPLPYEDINADQHTISKSLYGQGTVEVLTGLKLTAGLRYTDEKQAVDGDFSSVSGILAGPFHQESKFKKFTWRAAMDYSFAQNIHGYISYNRGIKSGGFNLFTPQAVGYKPERLDAYEVGLKSELFDRHVRLNVAAFYYDYANVQVSNVVAGAVMTTNAAKARMYGLDADLTVSVNDRISFSGGLGLLNARYRDFPNALTYGAQPGLQETIPNARGNHTPLAAPVTGSFTANYKVPLAGTSLMFTGTVIYNDGSYKDVANRLKYPSYTLLNGSIGWTRDDQHLGIHVWIKNATNALYYIDRYETIFGDIQQAAPPRTYGVTLSTKF